MFYRYFLLIFLVWGVACSGSNAVGTSAGNPSTQPKSLAFPDEVAIVSPFAVVSSQASVNQNLFNLKAQVLGEYTSGFDQVLSQISQVLNGTQASDCIFDPTLFFTADENAACYGPTVDYEGHPDANEEFDLPSGELPRGDVGLWQETDSPTGHACAAAQLNVRMQAMSDRTLAAMMAAASLVCVATVNGLELPEDTALDLTAPMNALGLESLNFDLATLTQADETWSYAIEATYNDQNLVIQLVHTPGEAEAASYGLLYYRVNEDSQGFNCLGEDLTTNASIAYHQTSATDLNVQVRLGGFCGSDVDGRTEGLVDPSLKRISEVRENGWGSNFSIFTAHFDPSSLEGSYSFSWQAGPLDQATRVLNAQVLAEENELVGYAYYGFGEDISETDGGLAGFYCNWAGPGGRGIYQSLAQYQSLLFNETTGTFDAQTSAISYAPVNSCNYDGLGSFRFDSDGDGSIDTDPTQAIIHQLVDLEDANSNGVIDALESTGFELPQAP